MPKYMALRHRYCVKVQGLFSGVEWTLLRDGRAVSSGEAPDVEKGLQCARRACRWDMNLLAKGDRRHA